MNIARTWQIESTCLEDTLELAAQIGSKLKGGEVIELASDLGGGKTAFVRGLAHGMGSQATVHSPSFTLSNQYESDALRLYHFDFYRLAEAGIMRNELAEALGDAQAVTAVEWADIVEAVLPPEHIRIIIKATGDNSRQLTFHYPKRYQYLFPLKT